MKWECKNGHPYTDENVSVTPNGYRRCRVCNRVTQNARRALNKAQDMAAKRVTRPVPVTITTRPVDAAWRDSAKCAQIGGDAWFPEGGGNNTAARAKQICATCPVAAMCLQEGLDEEFGVWGGLSPFERRQLRRTA